MGFELSVLKKMEPRIWGLGFEKFRVLAEHLTSF